MKRLNIEQKTPEWHDLRRNSLGASDAPVIMGISPYKTPLQLWEEKLGLKTPSDWQSDAMRKGNELEIVARDSYSANNFSYYKPEVVQSTEHPFLIASLDGMNEYGQFIEIKYNAKSVHEELKASGNIPDHHMSQIQHQLLVTGQAICTYISINSNEQIASKNILRDYDYIEKLLAKLQEFWTMVQSFTQPSTSDKDYVEVEDPKWIDVAHELIEVKKKLEPYEALKKKEEELRKTLIKESNGKSCVGAGIKLTKYLRKGAIDIEKMCTELSLIPEKLEQWRKSSVENWRLSEI